MLSFIQNTVNPIGFEVDDIGAKDSDHFFGDDFVKSPEYILDSDDYFWNVCANKVQPAQTVLWGMERLLDLLSVSVFDLSFNVMDPTFQSNEALTWDWLSSRLVIAETSSTINYDLMAQ